VNKVSRIEFPKEKKQFEPLFYVVGEIDFSYRLHRNRVFNVLERKFYSHNNVKKKKTIRFAQNLK